ncbi:MAG TPA: L-seryl-tRNA(Sec) selenium transferase [Solirubrobacteraceae bacterium]|nr:L-seryl-tRNA(Sec) selenium transferase [Solirubrobacteraceae bacterium]
MGARDAARAELRTLPAVHELAGELETGGVAHGVAVRAARQAIDERRAALRAGEATAGEILAGRARELAAILERPTIRRVLNATGVIVHTGLGRAPLAPAAREAVAAAAEGYANLELDLGDGTRGNRQNHVRGLLCELTGAEDALVVGNGAGAVLLAVAALAGPGGRVIVSRGQLVEIGGGFRIPEVIAASGAELIEVGTTNRTRLSDYERALGPERSVILRVHQSNFRTVGFVSEPPVAELCKLGVPVIDDVGSGALLDRELPALAGEPGLRAAVGAGAALVCCSADKLLGGPQGGLLVGQAACVATAAGHPLARALRIDKLSLAALAATLGLLADPPRAMREIPVLAMLATPPDVLARRAAELAGLIGSGAEVVEAVAKVGGGALPLLELPGPAVALRAPDVEALASALRRGEPPVVGRVDQGRLLLDPRTLSDAEVVLVAGAVHGAQ